MIPAAILLYLFAALYAYGLIYAALRMHQYTRLPSEESRHFAKAVYLAAFWPLTLAVAVLRAILCSPMRYRRDKPGRRGIHLS